MWYWIYKTALLGRMPFVYLQGKDCISMAYAAFIGKFGQKGLK